MARIIAWICAAVIAALYTYLGAFKFLGAPITKWLFAKSGAAFGLTAVMEPFGRLATGVGELMTVALVLIIPIILTLQKKPGAIGKSQAYGAALGLVIVAGAIVFHLVALGLVTPADAVLADSLAEGGAALPGGGFVNPDPDAGESPALFGMAVVSALACAVLLFIRRRDLAR